MQTEEYANVSPIYRMGRWAVSFVLILLFATSSPLYASWSESVGGDNGQPFTIDCNADEVMVGIRGRADVYIDSVQPLCARWRAGGWMNEPRRRASTGGPRGTPYTFQCPTGQAVGGLRGGAGGVVDSLQVICAHLNADGSVDTRGLEVGQPVGGIGGTRYSIECPRSDPGRGLIGRSGSWIDRIALLCGTPAIGGALTPDESHTRVSLTIRDVPANFPTLRGQRVTVRMINLGRTIYSLRYSISIAGPARDRAVLTFCSIDYAPPLLPEAVAVGPRSERAAAQRVRFEDSLPPGGEIGFGCNIEIDRTGGEWTISASVSDIQVSRNPKPKPPWLSVRGFVASHSFSVH